MRRPQQVTATSRSEQVGDARPSGRRWLGFRHQLVAIGLAGTVLHLVLVGTALAALQEVNAAHADVARINAAQADFQEADMAHDAMRADVLALLLQGDAAASGDDVTAVQGDVEDYRRFLRRVDAVPLPGAIATQLRSVRPLQEEYADDVLRLSAAVADDPQAARGLLPELDAEFRTLTVQQGAVTTAMNAEADRRQGAADAAERNVRWRLAGSAAAALIGMLGLTVLLHRLGGALAVTLARERGVAETLQRSLLPDRLPELPGVRLAARYVPSGVHTEVGGDWYDVVPLPSGGVGLVMGDVVGHDLEAAASMGQLRNALRAVAAEGAPPEEVLQRLNRLCLQQELGGMATVLYAVLDPVLGTLRMASAGHYPPLLVSGGEGRFLESQPCPPIGAVREVHYASTVHRLPPGSLLVLYTDGLVERRDASVDDGMARLRALVGARQDEQGLEHLCDAVVAGMLGTSPPQDDVALLAVAAQAVLGPHLSMVLPANADQLSVLRRTLERWLTEAGATDEEVYDITVSCSEATTNAIEHAYGPGRADVEVTCDVVDGTVTLAVRDWGQWRQARGQDRGRGLSFMRGLMDEVTVSRGERGTQVVMRRRLGALRPQEPVLTGGGGA